jgi:hypothetical protein
VIGRRNKAVWPALFVTLVVCAFGAQPALATDEATCSFTNLMGTFLPPVPAVANNPSGTGTPATGQYSFQGFSTCVLVDTDPEDSSGSGVVFGTYIGSLSGNYTATGGCAAISFDHPEWYGINIYSFYGDPRFEGPFQSPLHIDIAGGRGVVQMPSVKNTERTGGVGSGVVNFTPTGGTCVLSDVPTFSLAGALTLEV